MNAAFDLPTFLGELRKFQRENFGPRQTQKGIHDHLRKEVEEFCASEGTDIEEAADIMFLVWQSLWKAGFTAEEFAAAMSAKLLKLGTRKYPDWKTVDPDKAIEHDRGAAYTPLIPAQPSPPKHKDIRFGADGVVRIKTTNVDVRFWPYSTFTHAQIREKARRAFDGSHRVVWSGVGVHENFRDERSERRNELGVIYIVEPTPDKRTADGATAKGW